MSDESQGAVAPEASEGASEAVESVEGQESVGDEGQELSSTEANDEVVEELQSIENDPNLSKQEKTDAKKAAVKEWVLKSADGKEIKITDEKELLRRAQLGVGAESKFQESAQIKKEAAQLIKMLQEDPIGLLEELGLNTLELSQKRLAKQFEEEQKSPEQKEREQLLQELEALRNKQKQSEEQAEQARFEAIVAEEHRKIEDGMVQALTEAKLPIKPAYIKRMAEIMQVGLDQGKEITPAEALNFARKGVVSELRELLDAAPDELLEDLIGSNNYQRMRKKALSKNKPAIPSANSVKPIGNSSSNQEEAKVNLRDWMKR
jgi:hypothetical protein